MSGNSLFARITKVDAKKRLVYGVACAEEIDKADEIFDYATSKPHFEKWSADVKKDSGGKSLGNVRAMHGPVAAGKLTAIDFDDAAKNITVCSHVVDDGEWNKVLEGVYTGFSIGGKYEKRWKDKDDATKTRYTAVPSEISLVDRPAVPSALFSDVVKTGFTIMKADGSTEQHAFKVADSPEGEDGGAGSGSSSSSLPDADDKPSGDNQQDVTKSEDGEDVIDVPVTGTDEEVLEMGKLMADRNIPVAAVIALIKEHTAEPEKPIVLDPKAVALKAVALAKEAGLNLAPDADNSLLAPYVEKATEFLMSEAKAKKAEEDGKKEEEQVVKVGGMKFADAKNRSWPLDSEAHCKAAARAWGNPKNRARYSDDEQKEVGGAIMAACKEHGMDDNATKALVDEFDYLVTQTAIDLAVAETGVAKSDFKLTERKQLVPHMVKAEALASHAMLRKNLGTCASFLYTLSSLNRLHEEVSVEAAREGEDMGTADRIRQAIYDLSIIVLDLVEEAITEEYTDTEVRVPPQYAYMAESTKGLIKSLEAMGCKKREDAPRIDQEAVQKAFVAISGELTKETITSLQDFLKSLGAKEPESDVDKSDEGGTLNKAELADMVNKAVLAAREQDAKKIAALQEQVTKMGEQVAPSRVNLRFISIAKGEQINGESSTDEPAVKPVLKADGTVDASKTLIKAIHAAGPKVPG